MKSEWRFNAITGTMEPINPVANSREANKANDEIQVTKGKASIPVVQNGKSLIDQVPNQKTNIETNERTVHFKERSDLTIVQITDYDTNKVMGYISGYGLDINFNMEELTSMERVEQFLEGLKKAFRSVILNKALGK